MVEVGGRKKKQNTFVCVIIEAWQRTIVCKSLEAAFISLCFSKKNENTCSDLFISTEGNTAHKEFVLFYQGLKSEATPAAISFSV